jgi:CRP-like cAMP-binding protein
MEDKQLGESEPPPRRHMPPAIDESLSMERIANLQGFDRAMLRFGRVLVATGGTTLKSPSKGTVITSVDVAFNHLKKIGAKDFDTGKSGGQVAKETGYARITMSNALNDLVKRGLVKSEQRGRQVKYFLPTQ